jgi:hypothetical protein
MGSLVSRMGYGRQVSDLIEAVLGCNVKGLGTTDYCTRKWLVLHHGRKARKRCVLAVADV